MRNAQESKKVIDFYVLANKLKTTIIDEVYNYSLADNIFGSMILAIAMNSEVKENVNIGNLLKVMLLDEFSKLNPEYNIEDTLKKGKEYKEQIDLARSMQNEDGKLIYKYKALDYALTQLIAKEGKCLEFSQLEEKAVKLLNPTDTLDYDIVKKVFRFYFLNFTLKNKIRTGWDDTHWNICSARRERISEHVVGTIALAIAMNSEFKYTDERNIDIDKIIKLLAIHETGEILIGDITPFDGVSTEQKEEIEHKAMMKVVGNLDDHENLIKSLFDFDEQSSNEAKFAYLCDKMEADLQSKYYQDSGLHRSLNDQANNIVFKSSKVQQMLKDGVQTAFEIWYGYDVNKFKNNDVFPEFADILDVIRDNNLFALRTNVVKQKVELTENEYQFLIDELGKKIKMLMSYDYIDCVYMTNYQDQFNNKGNIILIALLDNNKSCLNYDLLIKKMNEDFKNINSTGIIVEFHYGYVDNYFITALNPSDVHRIETLKESNIIFDKSGRTTDVKNKMEKHGHLYPFYLVEYKPSLNESLVLKLQINNNANN